MTVCIIGNGLTSLLLAKNLVEKKFGDSSWKQIVRAPDTIVSHLRAIIIGGKAEQALRQGQSLSLGQKTFPTRSNERCRAYSTDGRFIGIIVFDATARRWQPQRVLNIEYPLYLTVLTIMVQLSM